MSKFLKKQKPNIHKLLEEDLYKKKALYLKELLGLDRSRNIKMKIFEKRSNSIYKRDIDKENYTTENNLSVNINKNEMLKELNKSIIKLFNKTYYLHNEAKKNYEQKKKIIDAFREKLKTLKQTEKERIKMDIKRNKSSITNNQKFELFNEIVNKYKKRDGIIYTKDLIEKDILQETPIVIKSRDKIKNFYIYNYNKYVKKTNLNATKRPKPKEMKKNNKNSNDIKKINFNELSVTNFYKKLFSISQQKIYQMEKKKFNPKKFKYNFTYEEDKQNYKIKNEILNQKNEIKNLKLLFKALQNKGGKNINDKFQNKYDILNSTTKKYINIVNEQSLYSSRSFQSTNRRENYEDKKVQLDSFRNIKILSPVSIRDTDNTNKKSFKKILIRQPFSRTSKNFCCRNRPKEEKSIMSQKTKTTFFTIKSKKDNIDMLTPRNEIGNTIYTIIEEKKDVEDIYEELKLISITNEDLIRDKIEQYLKSKGFNVEKIKNSIKKEQLYNFLGKIKNSVMNYNCKQNFGAMHSNKNEKLSEKISSNLNKIKQMDKEISSAENAFCLSLIKNYFL